MVPARYVGVWRRDWIKRRTADAVFGTEDASPAIWFQSATLHVDLRAPGGGQHSATQSGATTRGKTAFAGRTRVWAEHEHELCRWDAEFAYPHLSSEVDCGVMEFQSPSHLIETGLDGSYVESWQRLNAAERAIRCLSFETMTDSRAQYRLMLCEDYFAIGAEVGNSDDASSPLFAWGEMQRGTKKWKVRESLDEALVGREVEIDSRLSGPPAALIDVAAWHLPFFPSTEWRIKAVE